MGTDKNIKINFSDTHALKSWAEYFLFGVEVSRVYICILILSLDNTSRPCISRGQHWLLSLIWKRLLWKWIFFIDVDIVALVWVTIYGICNIFFEKGEKDLLQAMNLFAKLSILEINSKHIKPCLCYLVCSWKRVLWDWFVSVCLLKRMTV